jgi:YgiT-type zinc finger domain-containing protein
MEGAAMSCEQCGGPTTTARENFHYTASGLSNVTLLGVEVTRCPKCGAFEVDIPRIEELHRTIAAAVVTKRAPLTLATYSDLTIFASSGSLPCTT